MTTPKNTTSIFIGENNLTYLPVTLQIKMVFDAACFQSRSLVKVVWKNMGDIIPYNPDQ